MLDVGFSVVGPSVDVVDVAPLRRPVTGGEDAPGVTDPHRPSLGRRSEPGFAAHVQHDRLSGHHHSTDGGATPDAFQGGLGDRSDPFDVAAGPGEFGGVTVQGGDVDDGVEVWWVATGFGTLVIPVRKVRKGVTTTLRQRADPVGGVLGVGGCQMVQHVQ